MLQCAGVQDEQLRLVSAKYDAGSKRGPFEQTQCVGTEFNCAIRVDYLKINPAHMTFDIDLGGRQINMVEEDVDLALQVAFKLDEGVRAQKLANVTVQLFAAPAFLDRVGRPQALDDLNDAPRLAYS